MRTQHLDPHGRQAHQSRHPGLGGRHGVWRWILPVLLAVATTGCKVTADDIEYWKGTVKGPGKILAVVLSDRYPVELRTKAAMALVEMEPRQKTTTHEALNGLDVLFKRGIPELDEATRQQIVQNMTPRLKELMRGGEAAQQDEPNAGPPPLQVRAKDAAYLLITHAQGDIRQELIDSVVGWYVIDFNGRSLAGRVSAQQVVESLGAPAARRLVEALDPHMPQPALVKLAQLIGQLGDSATKKRAAERLVAIEREMEGPKFLKWLEDRVTEELKAQSEDGKVDQKRVKLIAALNREKFINEGALPAMKHLASEKVVAHRLLEIASIEGDNKALTERRQRALQALEGHVHEKHLDKVLSLALNANNPITVRDYAFDRVGDIRSKKALPQLWPLVQNGEDQRLRWRAGELVLAIGGSEVVAEFLSKLPSGDVEYASEELKGYATRMSQMSQPPTDLIRSQLNSSDWWDRVIALRFFERKGTNGDIARMKRLINDKAKVKGPNWEDGDTVGKVAKMAIQGLEERLSGPSADEEEG